MIIRKRVFLHKSASGRTGADCFLHFFTIFLGYVENSLYLCSRFCKKVMAEVRKYLFTIVFWVYIAISQVVAVYYFIQICHEESSYVKFIIDPFIAEIKGFLWPVFLWMDHII